MLRRLISACLSISIALSALPVTSAAAQAEGLLAKLVQGGAPRVTHARYVKPDSDRSPIAREVVEYDPSVAAGTIIVETGERRLYFTLGAGLAVRYAIGVAREGFEWSGENVITRKAEWPDWTPPAEMIAREAKRGRALPAFMPGGPGNPLGARALYIGTSVYRIHGTNQPTTIGQAMSSGCIRMANEDVIHLYDQVKPGARVIVR